MDVNHLNPILKAFKNVMPQLGLGDVEKKGVTVKGRYIESPGVCIIVGIVGDLKGNIIYDMTEESAKKIASVMMMGMPVDEFNELAQSAISELTNMLTANAATCFSEQGITVDISTPTLMYGEFTANASADKVLCIQLGVGDAIIDVNISFE
ncbi:MAG: chemotaxis protein CheX [Clostridiaceae bacterium]|nr:chemotaxis protein CheX [Clostridiaceae bacterium]